MTAAERLARAEGVRVVGDIHGDARAFAHALATDRLVVQLGDLADHGPDSAGTLRLAFDAYEDGRLLLILGNHDRKLARAIAGIPVTIDAALAATIASLDDELRARVPRIIGEAPAWLRSDDRLFVHGGFHRAMLREASPPGLGRVDPVLARALFGQTTGRMQEDGYPVRLHRWVDEIPEGVTVYCGHDRRSTDGRPYVAHGKLGGTAVFLDTGAGKGGHLSWIDL